MRITVKCKQQYCMYKLIISYGHNDCVKTIMCSKKSAKTYYDRKLFSSSLICRINDYHRRFWFELKKTFL